MGLSLSSSEPTSPVRARHKSVSSVTSTSSPYHSKHQSISNNHDNGRVNNINMANMTAKDEADHGMPDLEELERRFTKGNLHSVGLYHVIN